MPAKELVYAMQSFLFQCKRIISSLRSHFESFLFLIVSASHHTLLCSPPLFPLHPSSLSPPFLHLSHILSAPTPLSVHPLPCPSNLYVFLLIIFFLFRCTSLSYLRPNVYIFHSTSNVTGSNGYSFVTIIVSLCMCVAAVVARQHIKQTRRHAIDQKSSCSS